MITLFHGTTEKNAESIKRSGLQIRTDLMFKGVLDNSLLGPKDISDLDEPMRDCL